MRGLQAFFGFTRMTGSIGVFGFGRLHDAANENMTPELARHVLCSNFPASDRARMHELVVKNKEGRGSVRVSIQG